MMVVVKLTMPVKGMPLISLIFFLFVDAYAVRLDDYDIHEVANALKRFLRELDDSLFMRERYSEWVRTSGQ